MENNLDQIKKVVDEILLYLKSIESLKEENRKHIILILKQNHCLEKKSNMNFYIEVELLVRTLPTKSEVISNLEILKTSLELFHPKATEQQY